MGFGTISKGKGKSSKQALQEEARLAEEAESKRKEEAAAAERKRAEKAKAAAEAERKREEKARAQAEAEAAAAEAAERAAQRKQADAAEMAAFIKEQDEWAALDDKADLEFLEADPTVFATGSYSENVYEAFSTLAEFARELRVQRAFETPEFVFIGPTSGGKTRVIELLLGQPLLREPTKRPIEFTLVNNPTLDEPTITIVRDSVTSSDDVVVSAEDLPGKLAEHNVESTSPLVVRFEGNRYLNSTFIDTPGLSEENEDAKDIAKDQVQEEKRHLVFVSSAVSDWSHATPIQELADEFDPKLYRTTFVFTKFAFILKGLESKSDLNAYLSQRPSEKVKTFFVSTPSQAALDGAQGDDFQQLIAKAQTHAAQEIDERMGASFKAVSDLIGSTALRTFVLGAVYKRYADGVPELQKELRIQNKAHADKVQAIQQQISSFNSSALRATASSWSAVYLQQLTEILGADYSSSPHAHGQSARDEDISFPMWQDGSSGKPLFPDYDEFAMEISKTQPKGQDAFALDTKLYGAHQIVRLLKTWKAATQSVSVSEVSEDVVASARGVGGSDLFGEGQSSGITQSHIWVASDVARSQLRSQMTSLVNQLFERLASLMRGMSQSVEQILGAEQESALDMGGRSSSRIGAPRGTTSGLPLDLVQFPRFWWHVRELWENYVDDQAKACKDKCMDEIECTKLLVWNSEELAASYKDTGDFSRTVKDLAKFIFDEHRERIVQNTLLKIHEMLLTNAQREVSGVVQASINMLTDADMSDLFSMEDTLARMKETEETLRGQVDISAEPKLMTAAGKFRV